MRSGIQTGVYQGRAGTMSRAAHSRKCTRLAEMAKEFLVWQASGDTFIKFRLAREDRGQSENICEAAKHQIPHGIWVMQWSISRDACTLQELLQLLWPRSLTLSRQADKSERSFERSLRRSLCRRL